MTTFNATEARSKLRALINETTVSHQPIIITGKRGNAIDETLYLLSVPGMRESIREGMATGLDECDRELNR